MNYIFYFDMAAILLTVMLLLVVYARKAYPTKSVKIYTAMLWLNLIASVADLLSCFTLSDIERYSPFINYAINMIYLLSHNLTSAVFLIYVITVIKDDYGTPFERFVWVISIIVVCLLILTTPITGWVFSIKDGKYVHGLGMIGLYGIALLTLLFSLILFLVNRKKLTTFQILTDVVFLVLIIGAVVFQYFFPEYLIESFVIAVAFMMVNVSLDNPSIYLYRNSYCYNQNAFNATIKERLKKDKDFRFLAFTFSDFMELRKKYGDQIRFDIIYKMIDECHKLYGQKRFYFLDNVFVIDLLDEEVDEAVSKIDLMLKDGIRFNEENIPLVAHYCVLHNWVYVNSVGEVNDAINVMLGHVYRKTNEKIIYDDSKFLDSYRRETKIVHVLRKAIVNDEFEVYYQPIYDHKTKKFFCAEALVRLNNTDEGYVGPNEFIPIAEKYGLILDIGEIVLQKVCRFWRNANMMVYGMNYFAVNLSMVQMQSDKIVETIEEACHRYEVKPENIRFEITETAGAGEDTQIIEDNIKALIDKGYKFSLDDYGSGYSTATYFAKIPFTTVKIDKGILWRAMKEHNFKVVLNNTIKMTAEVGRRSVVEGVEDESMINMLTAMGANYFQGFYYTKPLNEDDFIEFLKDKNKAFIEELEKKYKN